MIFRDDGYAAVDWAARYLERVGELPVLAQVEPGEICARLPESAPRWASRSAPCSKTSIASLPDGITHWQSPRFMAYFATSGPSRESSPSF